MISSFIPIDGKLISKAEPPSYKITELKKNPTWTTYSTGWFTNSDNPDITITKADNVYDTSDNRFGIFINKRAETPSDGKGLINIESNWDQNFPETIKLRYPGSETKGNTNILKQLDNEVNYDFKIWQNRFSEGTISSADLYNNNNFKNMSTSEYFHDLLNFLNINKSLSYQEWLEMPSFSLKNLLGKSISANNVIYQLYKIDDVNVQSLSTNFDEYIPWCFDQYGKKIEQHKIALIYSFNKKEVYILLELRTIDIYYPDPDEENDEDQTQLREIKNIIFWRSGITDTRIDNISRSYDKTMLVRNVTATRKEAANISDYFRDQTVDSETVVSFQKDRFEDDQIIEHHRNKDNDHGIYEVEGNTSSGYEELEYGKTVPIVLTGNKNTAKEKIKIVNGYLFTNQNKNMFNIFVNGELQHMKDIEIVNQELGGVPVTLLDLPNVSGKFVEIYINSFSNPNLFMYLDNDPDNPKKKVKDITKNNLKATLYYSGLLWKLDGEEQVIIFDDGKYNGTETSGKTLILHGTNFVLDETTPETLPNEVDKLALEEFTSYRKIKYGTNTNGIVYDPMYMEVITTSSSTNTNEDIMTEDMWIFDNTYSDIKMDDNDNEPYLVYDNENNIKVFGVMDPNIDLVNINTKHIGEKYSIADFTKAIEDGNILSVVLDNAGQATYLKKHYEQMSVINNNVFNMFILSGYNETESWNPLPKNTELKINKDYAIVRFKSEDEDDFPLMEIDRTYNFDGIEDERLWTKVKPVKHGQYLYYIINRSADAFNDLYGHKFDKKVEYIII